MKKSIKTLGIVCLLVTAGFLGLIMFELENVSAGTTIYVDDDNTTPPWTGSLTDPYQTIQDGVNAAIDGDTVFVFNGTYNENVLIVGKAINVTGMNKDNTTIDGGGGDFGIRITAGWVNVTGFTITNGKIGIDVWSPANNVTISNNNVSSNNAGTLKRGINIAQSTSDIKIIGNDILDNDNYGIYIEQWSLNNTMANNNISSDSGEGIYLVLSSYNTIINNNISMEGIGIHLVGDDNDVISNHVLSNISNGIYVTSNNNNIIDNDVDDIYLQGTLGNDVIGNNVTSGGGIGLQGSLLDPSSNNNIIGNNISNNSIGIELRQSNGNQIMNNNLFSNSGFGIYVRESLNNNITNNEISNHTYGIYFEFSSNDNNITGNYITDNVDGIYISLSSEYNTITDNNIFLNTGNGTYINSSSNNNTIYHNNFIDNTIQAYDEGNNIWNDTYPSGGNFWSDWYFPDMDCDGFVDDLRPIAGGSNQDNWPFTEMNGWLSDWANKSAYPNYAPTGMPDFDQRQRKWMTINVGVNAIPESGLGGDDILLPGPFGPNDIAIVPGPNLILESLRGGDDTEEYAYCGPTSAANCLWWFDSKFANQIGTPGDGVDDHSLVVDLGAGDDHAKGNVPLLIEDLAARFNTNMVGATDHTNMINGLNQLLIDMGLDLHYQVYNQSWPIFDFVAQENEACNGVILFLGFYDDSGNRVWGHIVTVTGVRMGAFQIGISDPIKNVTNPMADFTAYNDPINVSHDVYDVILGPPPPFVLPPQSWYLSGYTTGYNFSIPFPHYAVVEHAVIISPNSAPEAPTGLTAAAGATYVNLTWNAPSSDGGSPITNYRIYRGTTPGGEAFYMEIGNVTYLNDTTVTGGDTYYYMVSAVNGVGEGPLSNEANGTPLSVPSAPTGLTATAGDSYVNLTWNVPASDGGSAIISYNIYRNDTAGVYDTVPASQLWYNDTAVINGVSYTYNVSAVNGVGEGPNSTVSATPMAVPSAPQNLQADAGDGYVNLTWSPPVSDGGSPITGYNIYRNDTAGVYDTVPAGQLWYNDTSVTNGVSYTYNVSAVNSVGDGPNSTVSATPMAVPSAPQNLLADAGDGFVNLTWNPPASDGGSPITGYNIYRNDTAGVYDTVPASQLWYNDTSVINGISYTYNVSAINGVGEGPNSTVSATPSGPTVPSAPQNLLADAGNGYVNLTWNAPASDGGSAITSYYIYRNDTAGIYDIVPASQLWYNDTSVTNGVSYTYNVSAVNGVGEGPNSTVSATPMAVPSAPQNLQADAGDGYVNLTWNAPASDGGSVITSYYIYRNDTAGVYDTVPAGQLWYNDTGVINGVSYTYNVSAVNSVGEGPNSTVSATPSGPSVPSAPQNLQANAGDGFVNLTWDVPADDGGSAITGYNIYRNDTAGIYDTVSASQLWYNDTSVINGVSYTYNVSAINGVGEGQNSTVSATPSGPTVPSVPQNLLADAGNGYVNLTWNAPASDGGSAITSYYIYRNDTAGIYDIVPASQLWYNDTAVTNGVSYTYNVSAVNSVGEGPNSTVSATPTGPTVPSATQNLQANAGDGFVNLTWDVPADDGGSAITGYNIYRNDTAGIYDTVSASQLWYNDTNVINGVSYTYNVSAINGVGEGQNSTVSATPSGPTVPSVPQNLLADAGNGYVNLTWNAPVSDGGSAITSYYIYRNDTAGIYDIVPASQLWYNDNAVTNGVNYTYNVSAVNGVGEGPNSTVSATPMTVPSAPQNLQASAGKGYVNLTWNVPVSDGGSPIIWYNIYRNDTAGVLAFVPASQLWYNDSTANNGVSYTYNVSAVNAIGEGPNSTVSVTVPTVPSAVQNLLADAGDGYVNLTWDVPSDDGGSSIIEYNIYRNDTAGVYDTVPASQLWYNDIAVINGMSYTYNVSAVNSVGEGPNSTVSATPIAAPSAPQNLQANAGDGYVNLTWNMPASDGGSPITEYYIYRNDTAGVYDTVSASQLWYNDTSVVNGVSYTYNVSAVNNIGEGPNSTVAATPSAGPTVPSAVQNLQAVTGDSYVNLTWDPPASDGGSPIIEYNIYRNGTAGVYDTVPATQPWYEDTNVINGITYTYNISAINSVGEGPNSTISATPMAVPSEPLNLQTDAGDGYINLTWEAPSDDGGSAIIGYNIYRNGTSGVYEFVPAGQLWYNDTNVSNGITYTYNVSAVNSAGEGPNSTGTSATPVTLPLAPQNLQANAGDSYVNLTWGAPTFDGGSAIIWYNIYRNDTVGVYDTVTATQLWYNDTNVSNGITYTYNVSANNSIGEGPNSTGINGTPMTVPSVTQNFQANAGDGYINLTWEAPSDEGGSAITWYNIYRNDTAGVYDTVPADRLWYNDTNVTNGMSYTYRVSANNSVGESPLSAERSIKAGAVPSAPRDLSATAGDSYVYLTWNPPAFNGGLPVTNYIIYSSITPGNETFLVKIGNVLNYNHTQLTNGITYYYKVSAENAIGEGPLSVEESATPFGLPSEPTGLTATAGDSYVNLTWGEPFFNGGFPITGYKIYRGETPDQKTLIDEIDNVTFYNDTSVTNDITYYYNVSAVNAFGEGPLSNEVNATPAVPSVPVNQPPTCEISSPSPGATISGTIEISGTASDTDGTVQSVEIRIDDGAWIEVNGTTSWSYDFDTTTLSNGQHTIYARSYDGENHSEEASVTVEVDNPSPAVAKSIFEEAWFWILIVLIIIIILLLAIFGAKKRKKRPVEEIEEVEEEFEYEEEPAEELEEEEPVEEFEEGEFEYEEEPVEELVEEEPVEEFEEEPFEEVRGEEEFVEEPKEEIVEGAVMEEELFECPECGATLGPTEYVCPSCGAEFEEEEEEELGKEKAEGEMFECPECGAALGPGDTVCPNCGIEFEEEE